MPEQSWTDESRLAKIKDPIVKEILAVDQHDPNAYSSVLDKMEQEVSENGQIYYVPFGAKNAIGKSGQPEDTRAFVLIEAPSRDGIPYLITRKGLMMIATMDRNVDHIIEQQVRQVRRAYYSDPSLGFSEEPREPSPNPRDPRPRYYLTMYHDPVYNKGKYPLHSEIRDPLGMANAFRKSRSTAADVL